jgi:hypothetical protein
MNNLLENNLLLEFWINEASIAGLVLAYTVEVSAKKHFGKFSFFASFLETSFEILLIKKSPCSSSAHQSSIDPRSAGSLNLDESFRSFIRDVPRALSSAINSFWRRFDDRREVV